MCREDSQSVLSAMMYQVNKHLRARLSQLVDKWVPALIIKQELTRVNR